MKPRKLKFGPNIRIHESVMCANFRDRRSRDRELRHKKKQKKRRFLGRIFINLLVTPDPLDVQS